MTLSTLARTLEYLSGKPAGSGYWRALMAVDRSESVVFWDASLGPEPTPAEIAAAELPATKAQRIAAINAECRARLIARYGAAEEQVSRVLGVYGAAEKAAIETGIAATIDASNTASDAVLAALDIAAVEAVAVAWPVI